jgi:Tfp pilus assembly protein PilX
MKPPYRLRSPSAYGQSGVVTLFAAIVLTVLVTLVTLFSTRVLVFEQRASANQFRSTQALEAAQSGLDQAVAWLQARSTPGTIENWGSANTPPCKENTAPPSGGVYSIYSLGWSSFQGGARSLTQSTCNAGMPTQVAVTMGALNYNVDIEYLQNISSLSDLAFLTITARALPANDAVRGAAATVRQVVSIPGGPAGTGGLADAPIIVKDCMVGVTGTPDVCPANVHPGNGNINQANVPNCAVGDPSTPTGRAVVSVGGPGSFTEAQCLPLGTGGGQHINTHGGTRGFLNQPTATVWETLFGDRLSKQIVKALAADGRPGFAHIKAGTNIISAIGTPQQPVLVFVEEAAGCPKLGPHTFHALIYYETTQNCNLQGGGNHNLHGTIAVEGTIGKFNANSVVRHSSFTGQWQRDVREGASVFARVPGTWRDF